MRQIVQDVRSGAVEVVDVPQPPVRAGHVLVRTTWSLISPGTEQAVSSTASKSLVGKALDRPDQARKVLDKALRDGVGNALDAVRARLDDLLTPGYSSTGIVEAVGAGVEGIEVGARVACVGANAATHAERVVVPAGLCLPVPDGLDDRWAAFGALGGIAAHGVRVSHADAGSMVVVIGLGLVGQLAVRLALAAGARVIGVDVAPDRVARAVDAGALAGATPTDDVDALVRAHTDGFGADAVIVTAASKSSAPVGLAATVARDRAVISVVGDVGLDIPRGPFYEKELSLVVSRSYGPGRYDPDYELRGQDYPIGYVRWTERRLIGWFLDEVARGRVVLDDLVTHEFAIEQGTEAYAALDDAGRLAILLRYPEPAASANGGARRRVVVDGPVPGGAAGRVALIGPGVFARATLLPQLRRLGVSVGAVAGPSAARAFGVARRWGAAYAAGDPEEVLADDAIDAVVIATRHDSHAALAARALQCGKAVFLEKPLAVDEQQLGLVEPLLREGGRLVVDFNRNFSPTARRAFAHFAGRTDPLFVHYRVNAGLLDASHWLRDPAQGGGRLVGEACHFVDFCSAAVGRPLRDVAVTALGAGPMTLPGDNFVLTLTYEDGSVATIAYVASGGGRMPKERVELLGAGRSAVIDDFRRVTLYTGSRRVGPRGPRTQDKGHHAALAAAFRFFREGGAPPIPYERLLETTRATFAGRAAIQDGS